MARTLSLPVQESTGILNIVASVLEIALEFFKGDTDWLGVTGGCFVLADAKTGCPLLNHIMGNVDETSYGHTYFLTAEEKCRRLAKYPNHEGLALTAAANLVDECRHHFFLQR